MKKTLIIVLALVLSLSMFGCGGDAGDTAKDPAAEGPTIGLAVSTQNNPFFVDLVAGAKEKATELGATLVVLDAKDDSATQMSNVEDLINQKVDLILINPTDSDAVGNAVKAANEAGIPVITLDRSATSGEVVSHIASDNVKGGEMAGQYIVDQLGGTGKVVELEGIPGASAAIERGQGFNQAIASATGITVVAKQTANFDRAQGLSVMENILQGQPEINAVFAHNDEMALGALEAIKSSGKDIMVVGFDATDDALAAVKDGTMAATVQQLPKNIGSIGVETAVKVLKGESVEQSIPVDLQLVTKDTSK